MLSALAPSNVSPQKPRRELVGRHEVEAFAQKPTVDTLRGLLDRFFAGRYDQKEALLGTKNDDAQLQTVWLRFDRVGHRITLGLDAQRDPTFSLGGAVGENFVANITHASLVRDGAVFVLAVDIERGSGCERLLMGLSQRPVEQRFQQLTLELEPRGTEFLLRGIEVASGHSIHNLARASLSLSR